MIILYKMLQLSFICQWHEYPSYLLHPKQIVIMRSTVINKIYYSSLKQTLNDTITGLRVMRNIFSCDMNLR